MKLNAAGQSVVCKYRILEVRGHDVEIEVGMDTVAVIQVGEEAWWALQVSALVDERGASRGIFVPEIKMSGRIYQYGVILDYTRSDLSYFGVSGRDVEKVFWLEANRDTIEISFIDEEELEEVNDWDEFYKNLAEDGYLSLIPQDGSSEMYVARLDQADGKIGDWDVR